MYRAKPGAAQRRSPAEAAALGAGALFLAVLVGLCGGTAVLTLWGPGGEGTQLAIGVLVTGGLLLMLGGAWLLLRRLPPADHQPGERGPRDE